ncbi:MAG TPA: XRE family transcriptional regulator [Actinomycetes bacterium]|nr:XRE family transcriptional regulator [Actinomycetes bacterium]
MSPGQIFEQKQIGQRIADARVEAGRTQADLAATLGLDRTALAKIEAGARKVSAVELAGIASELQRPLDWFLVESPQPVVSRRADAAVGHRSMHLDRAVDKAARDVEFLVGQGFLNPAVSDLQLPTPRSVSEAERAADRVRSSLGQGTEPLVQLADIAERLGLVCFSLPLGESSGDGAYVSLGDFGVAVINGDTDPGRRRFTLAHEIGHHVFADEYSTDLSLAENGDETERRVNEFASHLLLPRESVTRRWQAGAGEPREKAVRLGVEYRVSWSALCSQLKSLGLVTDAERRALLAHPPTRADFIELGMAVVEELHPPSASPRYAQAVLRAYRGGKLGANRTVDLLWGSVAKEELPQLDALPVEALRREFDPLP